MGLRMTDEQLPAPRRPTCFVVMPITTGAESVYFPVDPEHFRHVYRYLFRPAIEDAGYEPIEPEAAGSELIHARIIQHLQTADLVMCDLSSFNPNVMFELGVRIALNKPVALVHDEHTQVNRVFDIGVIQSQPYSSDLSAWVLQEQLPSITRHLATVADRSQGSNPMWRTFGIEVAARLHTDSSSEDLSVLVLERLRYIEQSLADASRPTPVPSRPTSVFAQPIARFGEPAVVIVGQEILSASQREESGVIHIDVTRGVPVATATPRFREAYSPNMTGQVRLRQAPAGLPNGFGVGYGRGQGNEFNIHLYGNTGPIPAGRYTIDYLATSLVQETIPMSADGMSE